MPDPAEIAVIPGYLARQSAVQGVMKIVAPLCVDLVTPENPGSDNAWIVKITLGNQRQMPPKLYPELLHLCLQLFQEVSCSVIDQCVNGVDSKAVKMIIAEPHFCVIA